jgi:hypothetical protein
MTPRMLLGIVLSCIFMTGILLGNMFQLMMIGEVNRKRSDGDQISYFGYHYFKTKRIFAEYRKLNPEGAIHVYMLISVAVAFASLVGAAVCARIIGG